MIIEASIKIFMLFLFALIALRTRIINIMEIKELATMVMSKIRNTAMVGK